MFPIAYSVRNSIKEIPVDTLLINKNRRLRNINTLYEIVWLGALEGVYKSVNIAIGIGWLVVVASEMIGTYSEGFWRGGLGYRLFRAYEHNDPNTMFFVLALFGGLGILSATIWERIYKNYIKKRDSNGD
jgi:ABC-type nitrate/sulfonate/bicarbonate transport system permease component